MRKVELELGENERYMIVGTDDLEVLRSALTLYHQEVKRQESALVQRIFENKQDEEFLHGLQGLIDNVMSKS